MRRVDARAKLVFSLACVIASITAKTPAAGLIVGATCLLLTVCSGVQLRVMALRLAAPLLFAFIMAVLQAAFSAGTPLYRLDLMGYSLGISRAGLENGAALMARVFGSVASVLLLTMTTPAHRLLSAAARFKVPQGFCEVALFAYRYIFVLLEDAVTVYHAQSIRLGYSGARLGIKSLGTLMGTVFLRAYSQAEATGAAMALRGYTGDYMPASREEFRATDAILLCGGLSLCLAVSLWT